MAEDDALGYWKTLVIMVSIIVGDLVLAEILKRCVKGLPNWVDVLTFWIAYVLTRPLGASIGDLLTADRYPSYDPSNCSDIGSSPDDVGCTDPDVYCITNCIAYYPSSCNDTSLTCP